MLVIVGATAYGGEAAAYGVSWWLSERQCRAERQRTTERRRRIGEAVYGGEAAAYGVSWWFSCTIAYLRVTCRGTNWGLGLGMYS
ncbi:hypothetical protein Hanom_Chr16g01429411 [Helianthus anomalus]